MTLSNLAVVRRCRNCKTQLNADRPGDNFTTGICAKCKKAAPRDFTAADKSLVAKVHGYMSAQQLLELLNERLAADLGAGTPRYTMEQLHAELRDAAAPAESNDWAGLRRMIAHARKAGVLQQISPQMIEDFAVVFSLTPAQVMRSKDVILSARSNEAANA